jgi:hypothetical protein
MAVIDQLGGTGLSSGTELIRWLLWLKSAPASILPPEQV